MTIINNLKVKIKNNKGIFKNLSYLTLLRIFNLLLPLITYPYLIKILGDDLYGEIILAQTICLYFAIIINFGLNISSTKDISIYRYNKDKLSEISSCVYFIKLICWIFSFLILSFLIYYVPYLFENKYLYFLSFMLCFNDFLFPQWYYQGVEKMGYITIINLCTRVFLLICIFIFVKTKNDFLFVPLFNGLGALLGGVLGLLLLLKKEKIILKKPHFSMIRSYVLNSSVLFSSDVIISIKDRLNVIFVGIFLGMHEVAIYDLAVKIMKLLNMPIDIVNSAIYPKVANNKDMKFVDKVVIYITLLMLLIVIIVQPFLALVINNFLPSLTDSVMSVRILTLVPIIYGCSLIYATNVIIVLGNYKLLLIGMIATTLFYLLSIGICFLLGALEKVESFIIITLLVYLFEFIYRYYVCKKIKLIK